MILTLLAGFATAVAAPVLDLDFTMDTGGMTNTNGLQWEWGELSDGPEGFTSAAWATRIDGDYLNDAVDTLGLPPTDLSGIDRPVLVLEHWYEIDEGGDGDFGWLEATIDGARVFLTPIHDYPSEHGFTGSSDGIRKDYFDLRGVDNAEDVQLVFEADAAVARAGWFIQRLSIDDGDPVPPVIQNVTSLTDTQDLTGPYVIHAEVTDDLQIPEVTLQWRVNNATQASAVMTHVGANLYRGEIPGMPPKSKVTWWIRAIDGVNTTTWPDSDKAKFDVFLAAPTDLTAPDALPGGRLSGLEAKIAWTPPNSPHPLSQTVVFRDDKRIASVLGNTAVVPLRKSHHTLAVAGIFETPEGNFMGDKSEALDLTIAKPVALELQPNHGFQGDTLRVAIGGVNLLMAHDQAALLLGEGVTVSDLELIDSDTALATVEITPDAPTYLREAILLSGASQIPLPGGFEVRDGADRPRLMQIAPKSIKQGSQTTLTITANGPIGQDPIVDLGTGIYVQSVSVDGAVASVEIGTAIDTPIGDHQVIVDDGLRILSGIVLEVRDARPAPGKVCTTGPGRPTGTWLLMLAAILGWRRRKTR